MHSTMKINNLIRSPIGMNQIVSKRFNSTKATTNLARILIFPVTKQKSYVHFDYNNKLINSDSLIVKYENKLVNLATKGWKSITSSEKSVNRKIVHYINKFLERTPWSEDSLRSIPSTSALLRQIKKSSEKSNEIILKNSSQLQELREGTTTDSSSDHEIVNIQIHYPSSIVTPEQLQNELLHLSQEGIAYHRKQMILTGVGIPLTLPFALVPVVPNVPGFYLAYRFYCNFKAYLGAEHLKELIEQNHLKPCESKEINSIYETLTVEDPNVLLNEDGIDKIVKTFNIEDAKPALLKALKQETQTKESQT